MPTSSRPRAVLDYADLSWEGAAPRDRASGDVFFSGDGVAETRHVFLDGNDLARRFAGCGAFVIGEIGFGAGLNALCAWALWRETKKRPGARLHILSVERAPFAPEDFTRAHAAWPSLRELSAPLRAAMPPPVPGAHRIVLDTDVTLTLLYGEAASRLADAEAAVDAWFLDGFAPAKNADAWTPALFAEAARLSAPGATLSTFTVAGAVRRGLEDAGFAVEKCGGFGRKKEMLVGRLAQPSTRRVRAPWFDVGRAPHDLLRLEKGGAPQGSGEDQAARPPIASYADGSARGASFAPVADPPLTPPFQGRAFRMAIVGGGIAGASLAAAARRAGLAAVLFDADGLAAGASGNPAGLVMPRLDLGDTPAARFFLEAFLYTTRLLIGLDGVYAATGARFGASDADGRSRLRRVYDAHLLPRDWLSLDGDGLVLPQAGVVDPARFVAALAGDGPLVCESALRIERRDDGLYLHTNERAHGPFDAAALANGVDAMRFVEARGLPLSAVAGQVDWFPQARAPETALAFGPYAAPAPAGGLVIGATYDRLPPGAGPVTSLEATRRNLDAVAAFAPDLVARLDPAASRPRASLRCQTPDRLPVAGPLPDLGFYAGAYDGLRTGLRGDYPRGVAVSGVYALTGLGSRGLVTAPLLAEMIVSEIAGAPSPVGAAIAQAVHPARFFIRDLKRASARRAD